MITSSSIVSGSIKTIALSKFEKFKLDISIQNDRLKDIADWSAN